MEGKALPPKAQKKKATNKARNTTYSTRKRANTNSNSKKKTSVKNKSTRNKTMSIKKKRRHREFTGILVIAFSILFALSIYHKNLTGLFGEILLHISTGMFGFIAYFYLRLSLYMVFY